MRTNRSVILPAAALAAFCVLAPGVAQSQNFDAVTIRTERLADGVYVLYGAGGNIGARKTFKAVHAIVAH